jgi:homoserine dehydrogenase
MTEDVRTLKVALLGAGTVGAEVARILAQDAKALARQSGANLELDSVVVRDTQGPIAVRLPRAS